MLHAHIVLLLDTPTNMCLNPTGSEVLADGIQERNVDKYTEWDRSLDSLTMAEPSTRERHLRGHTTMQG
jgi:hypothetical protein